jgi:PHP family Zn ribbon phosphoesterase
MALEVDDKALIIPAHAWTPWFSVFGSFSGFDSIEECFGDMAPYIYGIETGLSSDPAMNWQIGDLDGRAILSFSDAHSLEKMGREATVFEAEEISYESIYDAIKGKWEVGDKKLDTEVGSVKSNISPQNQSSHISPRISFTIEFYPEEGKYHFTGHRNCGVSQSPDETAKSGDICPVCGRGLTVGVMHRVKELETRNLKQETRNVNGVRWVYDRENKRPPYIPLVPLGEIIAEALGTAVKTKGVFEQYKLLVDNFGSEFAVLLKTPIDDLKKVAHPKVVDGIVRVRNGDIKIEPGYDGKFGVVKIWDEAKEQRVGEKEDQLTLFA